MLEFLPDKIEIPVEFDFLALPTIVWEKGKNQAYLNETG
jgi:hypothetical protein